MGILEDAKSASRKLKFTFPYDIDKWVNEMDMLMENYHKHTTWSDFYQIDSATSIPEFIDHTKKLGGQCYFSGEHGYQGEWLKCYDICSNSNMRFRYSVEAYWVKDISEDESGNKDKTNCHIVLVGRNYNGIRKINYILSMAHTDGYYYKPRIDLNLLFTLNPEDVYVTSACLAGWKYEDAAEIWYKIWKHFGDSFFLEYQTHNTDEQKELNAKIHALAEASGMQTIIGLDTHYLNEEDRIKRDNLLKRKGLHYDDEDGWYMDYPNGKEVYVRMLEQGVISSEEILYSMMNTQVFINGCEDLTYDKKFKIPILQEFQNSSYEERAKILHDLLIEKYNSEDDEHRTEDRLDGLEYEFSEIEGSGTVDYFLTNNKLVSKAVSEYGGILTTTSRGSASSYYSSKLLGFTTMDRFDAEVPIYPERFVTKDRILSSGQMPDIDLNVYSQLPYIQAARELCGEHGCYPLLAVGTFGEKSGFKMYADVSGLEPSVANDITTQIDAYNEALKQAETDEDKAAISIEDYITDVNHLNIFNESKPYQGIVEQAKVHACGFLLFNGNTRAKDVIGYGDIRYEIGLIRCHSESSGNSVIVANVEGNLLDSYGYVKDDFLIVDVVGIISKLYKSIGREVPSVTELRKMVTGDTDTWRMYEIGATCCLNQCEKPATTARVMKYKPQSIKELAAFIAGIRPGFKSLINGFLNRIEYTNGEQKIDDLLEDCFHYMLYQEAVMKIFSWLGIPMKESYDTIKKISKKKLKGEALQHVEDTLRSHWLENVGNLDNFEPVYKVIKDSARYSFNAPHALAMANDSLYEAWMKAHYTSKFYEVTMNHYQDKNDKDKVALLTKEAVEFFGYKTDRLRFGNDNRAIVVDDMTKKIYPSLSSIKYMSRSVAEDLFQMADKKFENFIDVLAHIKENTCINSKQLAILIKIDYFGEFGDINKLLVIAEKFAELYGKKNISKDKAATLNLNSALISKHATKITEKQYNGVNIRGLLIDYANTVVTNPVTMRDRVKYQYECLGYIDIVDESINPRYIVVTKLDTTYSPKFKAYCLHNGKECEMKVHSRPDKRNKNIQTTFKDVEIHDGDLLYMSACEKKARQHKTANGWEVIPNEFNWWLNGYRQVENVG